MRYANTTAKAWRSWNPRWDQWAPYLQSELHIYASHSTLNMSAKMYRLKFQQQVTHQQSVQASAAKLCEFASFLVLWTNSFAEQGISCQAWSCQRSLPKFKIKCMGKMIYVKNKLFSAFKCNCKQVWNIRRKKTKKSKERLHRRRSSPTTEHSKRCKFSV